MRLRGGILSILCTGVALATTSLTRAQDATSATLREPSETVEVTPTPRSKKSTSKPTLEISGRTSVQKAAPTTEQTPAIEQPAAPAMRTEKKTRAKKRTTSAAQPEPASLSVASPLSVSAAQAMAVSAPLPEYPYEAKHANVTGSGVCVMIVDPASGKVTSAMMAQSTGNAVLDKVTTETFKRWRFKPGTVSQVRVPITYE